MSEEKAKNEIIAKLETMIMNELDELNQSDENTMDKFEKGDVLFNIHKVLSNYDELKPVLIQFFAERSRQSKFEEEREEREER